MTLLRSVKGYSDILAEYQKEGRMRHIPEDRYNSGLLDLCSNDYLGFASKSGVWREEFFDLYGDAPFTSSASRLLAVSQNYYEELEDFLHSLYGKPALMFNSGYHANAGTVSALSIPGTLWLSDKLIHASIIDGLRLGKSEFKRWRHNDATQLRTLVEKYHNDYERIIVVCESVYSMDGDLAPLEEIVAIKREYPNVMIYLDEAHAVGVYGPHGEGMAAQKGLSGEIDILVGTLGKALASEGAFVICSELLRDYLVNSARSLIFSTAIPPINAAWSLFMIRKSAEANAERAHLAEISENFRAAIEDITGMPNPSRSAIVPLLTGSADKAVQLSERLKERGIIAMPIRRPTVPEGGERIRFSLNAALNPEDLEPVINTLREYMMIGV